MSAPATVLRLRGVERDFGGVHAIAGVDLEIADGERRTILGPNGAGKTTLFNLITGDIPVSRGTIELLGSDVTWVPKRLRTKLGLGRTYQISRLFGDLDVADNLYLAALGVGRGHLRPIRRRGRDGELRAIAEQTAERVGLGGRGAAIVSELSHGERRQLEIGMALAGRPRLLLLDEPAAGLSPGERRQLTELILSLDRSMTVVLIEHDMDIALTVADRVTMMHGGAVLVEGTPAEIRANAVVHDLYLGRAHAVVA
jgi:branched-chain amino acid transport system ATP-binding protein